jgi:hypothetical protein
MWSYESKGRGFESRRAHCPGTLKNKAFRGFSLPETGNGAEPESVSKPLKTNGTAVIRNFVIAVLSFPLYNGVSIIKRWTRYEKNSLWDSVSLHGSVGL